MKRSLLGISLLTISCLYGLLALIVILAVSLLGGEVLYAILASIFVIIIQFLISPWLTDLSMKWFYKAQMNASIPDYLRVFIEEECKKHNVVFPKIGLIDDGAPNAFTYGRTKKDSRIILTRGIFELLNEEEVKSVVGHEMGHIVHMDMMFMTAAQIVPLVLYAIYEIFAKSSNSDKNENKGAIIGLIAYVLYIICQYIILWLSRTREYYADEFSFTETRNPNALAEALVKIGFGLSINASTNKKHDINKNNALGIFDSKTSKALSISAMDEGGVSKEKIKNAMKWEMWNPWAKWFEFNSTHPLISKRLQAISKRSREFNQEPYIIFDLVKPESYADDFLLELLIAFLPKIFLLATFICFIVDCDFNNNNLMLTGIGLLLTTLFSFIKFKRSHKSGYTDRNVSDLLSEVKVSHITSIPCKLKGTIIGKGNPGCVFNEDFIIKDNTGIIFLDYNQPMFILNKIFAIFKSSTYFDKEIEVKGWYRRSPVPYVEIYEYIIDGKTKKIWTYNFAMFSYILLLIISVILIIK